MSRRIKAKEDKRDRISQAARLLFREKGYANTTTAEVAERAGIAAGTLFLYARTKEDLLLLAFFDEMMAAVDDAAASVRETDAVEDQILAIYSGLIDFHGADAERGSQLMRETAFVRNPERRDRALEFVGGIKRHIAAMIDRAKGRGEVVAGLDPVRAAAIINAAWFGIAVEWLNEGYGEATARAMLRSAIGVSLGHAPAMLPER